MSFKANSDAIDALVGHEPAREEVRQDDAAAIRVRHTHPTELHVLESCPSKDLLEVGLSKTSSQERAV